MATPIVQATQHVLVESATTVVSSLSAAAAAEFKTFENGIAQEVVSATDDNASNLLDKVEGAVEIVAHEVVNGVEHVVETVKQHPELIAEGVLAVAIGVASLVQPELIAGEIAILGKMAADSAKKTVTQIASDEGEKIVKAISKDLADDAKIEAEKDKLQAEEKKKAESGEAASDEGAPKTAETTEKAAAGQNGEKTIAIEIQKPIGEADKAGKTVAEKDAGPVELKITIGSDGQIKAVSKTVVEEAKSVEKTATPVVVEKTEVLPLASQETNVPLEKSSEEVPANLEPSTQMTKSEPTSAMEIPIPAKPEAQVSRIEPSSNVSPISKETSIPITQQAPPAESDSSVELATETKKQNTETEAAKVPMEVIESKVNPAPISMASEVSGSSEQVLGLSSDQTLTDSVQPGILAALGIVHPEAVEEPAKIVVASAANESMVPNSENVETTFVQQLLHRSNSGEPVGPPKQTAGETVLVQHQASVESVPDIEPEPEIIASNVTDPREIIADAVSSQPIKVDSPTASEVIEHMPSQAEPDLANPAQPTNQGTPEATKAPPAAEEPSTSSIASEAKELAVAALENSSADSGPALVTAAASVTHVTKTTTKTIEMPSNAGVKMVTISQESLENLHSKLDAMHEAIQLITKTLALHLPAPPSPVPATPKDVEVTPSPTLAAQQIAKPALGEPSLSAEAQPITSTPPKESTTNKITSSPSETSTLPGSHPPSPNSTIPKRPTHVKRGSVIGSIGKFLWPFGGPPTPSNDTATNVSSVEISAEVEAPNHIRKVSAPGLGSTKAVSTVEITEVLAMHVGA